MHLTTSSRLWSLCARHHIQNLAGHAREFA
jgi:hypothetical protein